MYSDVSLVYNQLDNCIIRNVNPEVNLSLTDSRRGKQWKSCYNFVSRLLLICCEMPCADLASSSALPHLLVDCSGNLPNQLDTFLEAGERLSDCSFEKSICQDLFAYE